MSIFRCGLCGKLFDISQQHSIDLGMNYDGKCFLIIKDKIENHNKRIHEAIIQSRSTLSMETETFNKEEPPQKGKKKQKYRNGRGH